MLRKPAIGFIFVTLALDILGFGLIIPITPKLIQSFQGGNVAAASHTVGMLTGLYFLMQFLFAPLLGSLSDRFGRRPVILASLFGSGLDYIFLAFAPDLAWFYLGRLIAGITGANFAAATAYIADVSPPEKRAANFGFVGAAFGLGFILGPALGGLLGDVGLRVPFLVAAGLTLLNWLYGLLVLPESLAPANRRAFSWARSNPVGSLLALRRYPMVLGLTGTYFLMHLAHQTLPGTWVLYTSYRYNWGVRDVGISLAIVGLMAVIVQAGLTGPVVRRLGEEKSVVLGLFIAALSYLGYGLASEGWMIYAILVFGSIGGITGPAVQALISRGVGADEQGGVQGSLTSMASVSGIIGFPIVTGLFGYFVSDSAPVHVPGAAFFFSSGIVLLAMLLSLRSFRKIRRNKEASTAASETLAHQA